MKDSKKSSEKNYFIADGKHYFKEIKKCVCKEKISERYSVYCKIHQYGNKEYFYKPGSEYMEDYRAWKKEYLTENTKPKIVDAIEEFKKEYFNIVKNYTEVYIEALNVYLYYLRKDIFTFGYAIKYNPNTDKEAFKIFDDNSLSEMLHSLFYGRLEEKYDRNSEEYKIAESPSEEQLQLNPLYISALKTDDKITQKLLKIYYHLESIQDCKDIEAESGIKILPHLSKEYDKSYSVIAETIDAEILLKSAYRFWHTPYFGMYGKTHKNFTLNPYSKTNIDASPENETPITFDEYLKLFD